MQTRRYRVSLIDLLFYEKSAFAVVRMRQAAATNRALPGHQVALEAPHSCHGQSPRCPAEAHVANPTNGR